MTVKFNLKELENEVNEKVEEKIDFKKSSLIEALKQITPVDTGKARNGWKLKNGNIVNDVDYIADLNRGSSSQAPSYFIESTLLSDNSVKSNGTIVIET